MFFTVTRDADINIRGQEEIELLVDYLSERGYSPILRTVVADVFEKVGLPKPKHETRVGMIRARHPRFLREPQQYRGELFFTNDFAFAVVPLEEKLRVSVTGVQLLENAIQEFCTCIQEGVQKRFDGRRVRGMKFEWETPRTTRSRYLEDRYLRGGIFPEELLIDEESDDEALDELNSTDPSYSEIEAQAADLLVDNTAKNLVMRLAKLRKMRAQDIEESETPLLQKLQSLEFITEEYLLHCRNDDRTICVVPSKDAVNQEPLASVRCDMCDNPFHKERLQTIYTLTAGGRKMVNGSLWMTIWLTKLLIELGVEQEKIKWSLEASGEDLDMMVEEFGSRTFFELKDREFGLGDAYPFVNRVNRYGGTIGIVATMDTVSQDAKRFFEEGAQRREISTRIEYFEGQEGIQQGIMKLFEEISQAHVRHRLVEPLSYDMGVDLWPVMEQWIEMQRR